MSSFAFEPDRSPVEWPLSSELLLPRQPHNPPASNLPPNVLSLFGLGNILDMQDTKVLQGNSSELASSPGSIGPSSPITESEIDRCGTDYNLELADAVDSILGKEIHRLGIKEGWRRGKVTDKAFLNKDTLDEIEEALTLGSVEAEAELPPMELVDEVDTILQQSAATIRREIRLKNLREKLLKNGLGKRISEAMKLHIEEALLGSELLEEIKEARSNLVHTPANPFDPSENVPVMHPRSPERIAFDYILEHKSEHWAKNFLILLSAPGRRRLTEAQIDKTLSKIADSITLGLDMDADFEQNLPPNETI